MKKYIPILILALVLAITVTPVIAAPDVPGQLHYVDAQLSVFQNRLDEFQANYHAANGVYFQALESHATAPDTLTPPDQLDAAPTDQAEALAVLWNFADLPGQLDWSFRVDTYSGPDGDGYVVTVQATVKGVTWARVINYGPDAWRNADWYQVVETEN